eukprot:TRINITY_DN9926_c0_g6_i4.p1 TRINITY_DN9926_c0_g6~~TRINITY_DN9926_c0_g6_i4.p1  ORF type:complete len:138 (+),score=38.18 TRINITY_DN9926_c0_g6_i4:52-465(+)
MEVLIWAGDHGDIVKSPHMARIANSVYQDVCPEGHTCADFGFKDDVPTERMKKSLLWKMHGHGKKDGVKVDPTLFEEAYTSKYGFARIFKVLNASEESKAWVQDPLNWKCDAPGSWHCSGQYPPELGPLLKKQKAFT